MNGPNFCLSPNNSAKYLSFQKQTNQMLIRRNISTADTKTNGNREYSTSIIITTDACNREPNIDANQAADMDLIRG